ncbi:Sec7 domain family protein [Leishmania donovani]|uniref:Sec7 domain family protein n=1 Tax=Leishmania donovani TaxID=5661 RepID=A0A504WWL9_LEIDO|nr:Sec7 domain family protein [Leishmania donovani]
MEKGIEEIVDACAHLLAEMKSDTRERTILSAVSKTLKRLAQESRQHQDQLSAQSAPSQGANASLPMPSAAAPSCSASALQSSGAKPSPTGGDRTEAAAVVSTTSLEATEATQSVAALLSAPSSSSTSVPTTTTACSPLQRFLCNDEELSKLAYACRMAIMGENGGLARNSVRILTAALELAAVVLTSGVLPSELVAPAPTFAVPESTARGAKVFLSKLLGGKKRPSSPSCAGAPDAVSSEITSVPADTVGLSQNVRDCLVDAVLAAVDTVQSKESSDRLYFVMIVALKAAAAPRLSRKASTNTQPSAFQPLQLSVHDGRLVSVFRALLELCSRSAGVSPILIDEAQKALHAITRALSKYVEQGVSDGDDRSGAGGCSKEQTTTSHSASSSSTGTPLMPLPTAVTSISAGKPTGPSFVDPPLERTETDNGETPDKARELTAEKPPSTTSSTIAAAAAPLGVPPVCDRAETTTAAALTAASPPRRLRGVTDMLLLLELCGHIARLTPLSCISSIFFSAASLNEHILVTALSFLLYSIVNGGPQFRKSPDIVQLLRQVVVPAAIRTSISADLDIFRLSINVLLSCCLRFGPQMVSETSTVFRHVYFRVLDSSFTSLEHKLLVLEAFGSYIEEPQLLLGLFLNYDCNTHSQSFFEMMIHYLGALAMPPAQQVCNSDLFAELKRVLTVRLEYDVPEPLRRKALVSLLQVSDSNIQWIERFECDQEEDGHAGTPSNGAACRDGATADTVPHELAGCSPFVHDLSEDGLRHGRTHALLCGVEVMGSSMSGVGSNGGLAAAANVDAFLQARRYKDAFKKFLDLFNQKAAPDAAIEYLENSVLILESAGQAVSATPEPPTTVGAQGSLNDRAGAAAIPTTATGTTNASTSDGLRNDDAEAPSDSNAVSRRTEQVPGDGDVDAAAASPAPVEAAATPTAAITSDVDDAMLLSARKVAAFLRVKEDYLDKMVLGDYFAKCFRRPSSRVVFEEWIGLHDFTGKTLDEALRLFLGGFKLLGEAQVVDKTMELFAAQYCRQNPGIFGSADTAFILSFSICMLNTDAHSPHIKNKMTKEGFLQNNRGIDEGNDIDPSILGGIYDRISGEEILTTNLLDSIPLLRHLSPIAAAITDKVLLPMDAAGNALFNSARRKREEMYQQELRATLKEVMNALQEASTNDAAHHAMFLTATSIENALPMWEVSVDVVCHIVVLALQQLLEDSEKYVRPQSFSSPSPPGNELEAGAEYEAVTAYLEDTQSAGYFSTILLGLQNTVRVCCAFGNVSHTEKLLEHMFEMTRLTSVVVLKAVPSSRVMIKSTIPFTRLQVLSTFFNLFMQCGSSFNARGWQAAYKAMSLVDALANGIEGMWQRQARRLLDTTPVSKETSLVLPKPPDSAANIVDRASRDNRKAILWGLRSVPTCHVDLWLDRLFDATQYPPRVQLEMTSGLVKVCEMELQYTRTFSLTKLFDFVSICASFLSRLQWRDLWAHASEVFTLAGCRSSSEIALSSLDGLRLVALTYLMREELLNYSFQKEVLKPFELILMSNQNVACRQKVMMILSEVIDFRAEHLASGWNVVFSCLSHAAAIPEVAPSAWSICEGVILRHISYVKDCFSDLIFCLTTFACSGVEESMPLRAISYLVACGHWLQYGLEAPPLEVRTADAVTRWATRYLTVEQELAASHVLGKPLSRVTLAAEPLTLDALLQKPMTFTSKTKYHLWMSLFEGMVPIVVVHSSVRVRAHALSSIWALLAQYAGLFDAEVRSSLFNGMVRPMLTTLLTHVPGDADLVSPTMSGGYESDRFDYRLLVYLALKGMLLACKDHAHLLELACKVLNELVESTNITMRMLRNDYVDEVLRVCYDFVWAAPSLATMDALDRLPSVPGAPSSKDAVNYAERLYQWIPTEARHDNPFVVGLVHEIQQAGVVDVVHFKRTAGWVELHQTPAARNTPVQVSLSRLSATSVQLASAIMLQIRSTIFRCLTHGLLGKLQLLLSTCEADRNVCLEVSGAMRHVLLGVSFYFLVTRDARAVRFLKSVMATSHEHGMVGSHDVASHTEPASLTTAAGTDASAGDGALKSRCSSTAAVAASPAFIATSKNAVLETLLLIPYACVLIEFIAAFDLGEADDNVVRNDLWAYVSQYLEELKRTRLACIELQQTVQAGVRAELEAAATTTNPSTPATQVFKEYKGCHFTDIFRSARYPIGARTLYLTAQSDPSIRQRVFTEWCYLLRIYALKCTAILGASSVVLQACPTRDLIDVLRVIPSAFEEAAVSAYFNSCWEEMDLHCSMPPEPCVELCARILESRM